MEYQTFMPGIKFVYHWTIVLLINTAIHVSTNFRVKKRVELKLNITYKFLGTFREKAATLRLISTSVISGGVIKTFEFLCSTSSFNGPEISWGKANQRFLVLNKSQCRYLDAIWFKCWAHKQKGTSIMQLVILQKWSSLRKMTWFWVRIIISKCCGTSNRNPSCPSQLAPIEWQVTSICSICFPAHLEGSSLLWPHLTSHGNCESAPCKGTQSCWTKTFPR